MTLRERIKHTVITHKRGIMGTVIFHLVIAILLVSMGISTIETRVAMEIELEVPDLEVIRQYIEQQELIKETVQDARREETTLHEEVEQMLRSIAVNEDIKRSRNNSSENVERYIREIQEELQQERSGSRYSARRDENYRSDSSRHQTEKQARERQRELDSLQSTLHVGESSVSYSLKNRYQTFLPIPIFKCLHGGKVVVAMVVNPKGVVLKAEIVGSESENDDNLREVAVGAALRARFNEDAKAPERQSGTITYHFVKQ